MVTAMNWPRRMSMYLGASETRSLAAEIELAVLFISSDFKYTLTRSRHSTTMAAITHILVVTLLSAQIKLAKNIAALPPADVSHLATISYG